jgi:hypothetical protein
MIEPVALKEFLLVFWITAGIIVFGGGYAGCYALGRARASRSLHMVSYLLYGALFVCVVILDRTLHFEGHWRLLSLGLVMGYFWAPRLLLRLTAATHANISH